MSESKSKFIDRELSWLEFNARVLAEGMDPTNSIFERLNFVGIVSSNFDEFFMIRVAGLQSEKAATLRSVQDKAYQLMDRKNEYVRTTLIPDLKKNGIERVSLEKLKPDQIAFLEVYFREHMLPHLTVSDVSNLDNLAVYSMFKVSDRIVAVRPCDSVPRILFLPADKGFPFVLSEDLLSLFHKQLFSDSKIKELGLLRVTRDANLELEEQSEVEFPEIVSRALKKRNKGQLVLAEVSAINLEVQKQLNFSSEAIYLCKSWFDLHAIAQIIYLPQFQDTTHSNWVPKPHIDFEKSKNIWTLLKEKDFYLHHPYDSFDPVVRFLHDAADDPLVLEIKQTLYRTDHNSTIIAALERAAKNGKKVTVLVEIKARFDEEKNIRRALRLQQAGATILYGKANFKTHAKMCLVLRDEADGKKCYAHLSTGNYHEKTAQLYSDVGIFTSNKAITTDLLALFDTIAGTAKETKFSKIEVSPFGLKAKLLQLIRRETELSKKTPGCFIRAKMNSLVDQDIIEALYEASRCGVQIELNIRGICCLRPGVKGQSEKIRVISIVDKFLEHSRIFHFRNGGQDEVYLSSADWMPRNFERRVEIMFPIENEEIKHEIIELLGLYFQDNTKAWQLMPDGSYEKLHCETSQQFRVQSYLRDQSQSKRTKPRKEKAM